MRNRIAVICANNAAQNTGMFSVDLAAVTLFHKHGVLGDAKLFHTRMRPQRDRQQPNYAYHLGDSESARGYEVLEDPDRQLEPFEKVLFWGDFLHARRYFDIGLVTEEQVYKCLLLEGAAEAIKSRTIAFGGCLLVNTCEDEQDGRYMAAIRSLYTRAISVTARDPISAVYAARYSGFSKLDTVGIDCSLLLDSDQILRWSEMKEESGYSRRIGYYFGRSRSQHELLALVRALGAELSTDEFVDLEWNTPSVDNPTVKLAKKLTTIRSCTVIVTDTYHCALNALREGIPTVCIGSGAQHPCKAIDDKKKELLYLSLNLKDYYVFREELPKSLDSGLTRKIVQLLSVMKRSISRSMPEARSDAERRLLSALEVRPAMEATYSSCLGC